MYYISIVFIYMHLVLNKKIKQEEAAAAKINRRNAKLYYGPVTNWMHFVHTQSLLYIFMLEHYRSYLDLFNLYAIVCALCIM